MLSKDVMRQ